MNCDVFYEKILTRGFYAEQLKIWYDTFPKNNLFMISSEEFANNPDNVLKEVFEFLEVPYVKIKDLTKHNKRNYNPMKEETRNFLIDYFKPHNQNLYELINKKFDWDR